MQLPGGCTINGSDSVDRFFCDRSACTSCGIEFRNNVCCCRMIEDEEIEADCINGMTFSVQNATRCGCTSCDDIPVTVQITVVSVRDNTPIPAAQILRMGVRSNESQLLGITLNNGQLVFQEPLGTRSITIQIQAPNFLERTQTILLQPGRMVISITVALNPLLVLQFGLGGAVTLRLGQAAVSIPAGAFHPMNAPNQTYEDIVTFRGVFMDTQDDSGLAGLPATTFEYRRDNGIMERFSTFLVTFLNFEDVNGEPLMVDSLSMTVSVPDDGASSNNNFYLVVYNETTNTWTRTSNFSVVNIPGVQKRQANNIRVVEDQSVPLSVFAAVATDIDANCWIQARTFDTTGDPLSGTFVRLEQTSTTVGNAFMYRFGTDTGSAQTAIDGLVSNAICLPLACDSFTTAFVEAREGFATTTPSLTPVDFPADTFNAMEDAPITIGDMFLIQSVITSRAPLPFYASQSACMNNGGQTQAQANPRDYFSFNPMQAEDVPANGLCYIRVLIRDCFPNNSVTVSSINAATSAVDFTQTVLVSELEDFTMTEFSSGGDPLPTQAPVRLPCNSSNATPRGACISFNCSSIVQVFVRQSIENPTQGLCDLTSRSTVLNSPLISGSSTNQQLLIDTSILFMNDYNDPDIGLYHDPTMPQMALSRCLAGNDTIIASNVEVGYAAEFTCF